MTFQSRRTRSQEEALRRQPRFDNEEQGQLFRRSRTLTGSVSSRVAAAREERSQLKSPRLKVQDLRAHRRKLFAGTVLMLGLSLATLWLIDQYVVDATVRFTPASSARIDADRYQTLLQNYMSSRPFERFRFMLNKEQLVSFIQAKAPEVSDAAVSGGSGLVASDLVVTLRKPVAKWHIGQALYYVDAAGQAFSTNYFAEPHVTVQDSSGVPPSPQQMIASTKLLAFIGQTVAEFEFQGVGRVSQLTIPPATLKQIDVTLEGRSYRLKLNTDREIAGQVFDAKSALSYLDGKGQQDVQYVDIRVPSKAYYR